MRRWDGSGRRHRSTRKSWSSRCTAWAPTRVESAILPEMLARILGENAAPPSSVRIGRVAQSLLERVPVEWRHAAKKRLPRAIKDWLTEKWYMGASDVSTQRAFSLVADLQGYIRINRRGRERNGLVEPGEELDALCGQIQAGLRSFVDADTREPIVHDVVRLEQVCAPAERLQLLRTLLFAGPRRRPPAIVRLCPPILAPSRGRFPASNPTDGAATTATRVLSPGSARLSLRHTSSIWRQPFCPAWRFGRRRS